METIAIDDVRFVKELYPRLRPDDAAIERYRASLELLPPIVVARDGILVDGYHRWQAFRREEKTHVPVINLGNLSESEIIRESIARNATHGQQLSAQDKQRLAAQLWQRFTAMSPGERTPEIAALLAVSERSVRDWTKDARKAEKDEQQAKALDMWLDCVSQSDIAKGLGIEQQTVSNWLQNLENFPNFVAPPESRQHFDVWQFATADKDAGSQSYFGAMPPQVVENLLWFYTDPGSVVVDLFAGSGTTVDVAKRMGRRVWASDIRGNHYSPHLRIHQHDATRGWPDDAPRKADLVILDPPYWKQADGRYSSEPGEMAQMSLPDFYAAWRMILTAVAARIGDGGRIAYIISPTQNEDGSVIDHATDMLGAALDCALSVERRIIVPYSTQQATGQQVTWARENRRMLKLYRDLVILRKDGAK